MNLTTTLRDLLSSKDTPASAVVQAFAESVIKPKLLEPSIQAFFPLWSLTDVRAEVVDAVMETADTRSFILRPNSLWNGAIPGQFIPVTVEINGRQITRHYSLSRLAGGLLQIAVKKQGRVSGFMHESVQIGDVLTIGQAAGEFVWMPETAAGDVLLIAGGSGITAIMGVLQSLLAEETDNRNIRMLVCSRNEHDVIFRETLAELQDAYPALNVLTHFSDSEGFLTPETLEAKTGNSGHFVRTYLCGPAGLMESITAHFTRREIADRLVQEAFTASPVRQPVALGEAVAVKLVKRNATFESSGADNLLVQMEAQGLDPKYGCRMGICGSCQCTKKSGASMNLLTGEISVAPDEIIRPCITAARSDLELDL